MIALGTATAFIAAIAASAAAVLQASEARQLPARDRIGFGLLATLMRRRRWVLGTMLLVLAWPLQVLALALAPITVVQPTLATFPVFLLLFARYGLHEPVTRKDVLGVIAITAGIILVVAEAPRHTVVTPPASHFAAPLTVVGVMALAASGWSRLGRGDSLALAVCAGLGYAWVDFADKLLSNAISRSNWGLAAIWLVTIVAMGALAFLQENAALSQRRAIQVGPLIGALQDPLPVLMALWAGIETWGSGVTKLTTLACGLSLVVVGALVLRGSDTAELATLPVVPSA